MSYYDSVRRNKSVSWIAAQGKTVGQRGRQRRGRQKGRDTIKDRTDRTERTERTDRTDRENKISI